MKTPTSINETQKGLLNKEFSTVELVDSYLAKIKNENKNLNAFLTVAEETAYNQAKKLDSLLTNKVTNLPSNLPLFGTVVAHKDLFLTKGIRTTASSKVLESFVPQYSATVVDRIEKAGGILIGKTNCDAWAHGASGENSDFGPTKKPLERKICSRGFIKRIGRGGCGGSCPFRYRNRYGWFNSSASEFLRSLRV